MTIWFSGIILKKICQKCEKNESDIMFQGMPPTNPEIVVFSCWDCYDSLDKDEFKIEKQVEYKFTTKE